MRPDAFRRPVVLDGRGVRLTPLEASHRDALVRAARDPAVGEFLVDPPGQTPAAVGAYVAALLAREEAGGELAFVLLRRPRDEPVGVTRFLRIDRGNDSVEIGGTWLDRALWRTPVNTEAKYLLLRHAFEVERVHRVWLQTDLRNERSRRAIARLGAVREGVLREDRHLASGYRRSSVVYSVLADEWPRTRSRLEALLARPWDRPGGPAGAP